MLISAKQLSEAIRMKRKKLKRDGVENMVDTAPAPQMDPNAILLNKQTAQYRETMGTPEPMEGPSDPADETLDGTQEEAELKRRMARVGRTLAKLKVSGS